MHFTQKTRTTLMAFKLSARCCKDDTQQLKTDACADV